MAVIQILFGKSTVALKMENGDQNLDLKNFFHIFVIESSLKIKTVEDDGQFPFDTHEDPLKILDNIGQPERTALVPHCA